MWLLDMGTRSKKLQEKSNKDNKFSPLKFYS